MKYPVFPKENNILGISAPSAGVGKKLESFEASLNVLHKNGFRTKETASVRSCDLRSASPEVRGIELTSLFSDPEVAMVLSAAGGDFLDEILPYTNFETMTQNPKWLMGASDPTSILYPYTTKYDIATIYGMNAGSFDLDDFDYVQDALRVIRGENLIRSNYPRHMSKAKFMVEEIAYDSDEPWKASQNRIHTTGRCIGGCIDSLKDLIGTEYDGTKDFIERYKEDGQIFYFDNFALSAENFYRTLLQFRYAGWFKYTTCILVGRVCFESSDTGMTYEEALAKALPDIPYIYQADIGHTIPMMTLINGAMLEVSYDNGKASLAFDFV